MKYDFQGNTQIKQVRLQNLKIEFENWRMKDDEKFGEYCVRFRACVNKMDTPSEEVKNEVVMNKMLRTLLPKCSYHN